MGKLTEFLTKNKIETGATHEVEIKPFPHPFVIKSITQAESTQIRKSCTVTEFNKRTHQKQSNTDSQLYLTKLVIACTVDPCFKDAELQAAYGVLGAEELVERLLTPGQFAALVSEIEEINGFDSMPELIDEAKN